MNARNVPLIVKRAEAERLSGEVQSHNHGGIRCHRNTCRELREARAKLAACKDEIKHWFDPDPATVEPLWPADETGGIP